MGPSDFWDVYMGIFSLPPPPFSCSLPPFLLFLSYGPPGTKTVLRVNLRCRSRTSSTSFQRRRGSFTQTDYSLPPPLSRPFSRGGEAPSGDPGEKGVGGGREDEVGRQKGEGWLSLRTYKTVARHQVARRPSPVPVPRDTVLRRACSTGKAPVLFKREPKPFLFRSFDGENTAYSSWLVLGLGPTSEWRRRRWRQSRSRTVLNSHAPFPGSPPAQGDLPRVGPAPSSPRRTPSASALSTPSRTWSGMSGLTSPFPPPVSATPTRTHSQTHTRGCRHRPSSL